MPMDEVDQPVRQIAGEIRAVVGGRRLCIRRRVTYTRGILFAGELDVRIGLVVAQQDVEARLPLLDEVVLERERFLLVVDQDVVDVAGFGDQRAGLDVGQPVVVEVAADAAAQVLGLADVDDRPVLVFVEVHAGQQGQLRRFFAEVHGGRGYTFIVARD